MKFTKFIIKSISYNFSTKNHFSLSNTDCNFITVERRKSRQANKGLRSTVYQTAALPIWAGQPE
jgi:hypothetical protein